MTASEEASIDEQNKSGIECLVLLIRFFGKLADRETMLHAAMGRDLDLVGMVTQARKAGLKAKIASPGLDALESIVTPCIAKLMDGQFVVIGKIVNGAVLLHAPVSGQQSRLAIEDFAKVWSGELVLLARRLAESGGEQGRFGVAWFIPHILKYRRLVVEVLAASFFLQIFALVTPLFFQATIDKVLVHRGLTTLDLIAIGLVAIAVFEATLGGLRSYVFSHTASRIDVVLGARLFRHLMTLPIGYFASRRVGDTIARVRELENIRSFLTGSALTLVIDVLFSVVFFAVMWWYSPALTLITMLSIPALVLISLVATPVLRGRVEQKFARGSESQSFLVEAVSGAETLKSMALEPQMQGRWEDLLAGYVSAGFNASNIGNVAGQAVQLVGKMVTAATLYFGARLVISGDLTIGALVAFNMLSGRVAQPVLRIAQLWQDFQQMRISIDRVADIMDAPSETGAGMSRVALPPLIGNIEIDNIVFRYRQDGAPVLDGVSLKIPAGQVVGIVGPSGSGKSTLAKLMQRLYVPERGRVLVDGMDVAMADPVSLRRQIGVVLQDNVLFNRTIRENIALSNPAIDFALVVEAARLAGAHEFIVSLPEGYDTMVGERGGTLSGGQRQRIAIARALIGKPRILIFDEATSALDYESEDAIRRNMAGICRGRTVIIIAHRLAAVRQADRIISIENSRIIEDGTHAELLAKGGRYAAMHAHQGGGENV